MIMDTSMKHILVILFFMSSITVARNESRSLDLPGGVFTSPLIGGNESICQSMVERHGYVCQEHEVTTKDGYILGLQRIPVGRSGQRSNKPPVLLQHGVLVDAAIWLMSSPDESIAFILADNGYDVWLANTRGTKSSLQHTSLTTNNPAYWEWSSDELVAFDLPATWQYVYNITGQKLHYVGHSLGTLIALSAFSENELVNVVRSAVLLGPVAYLNQVPSPVVRSATKTLLAKDMYWLGLRKFPPTGEAMIEFFQDVCDQPLTDCLDLMSSITGPNCCVNSSTIHTLLDHAPQETSTKTMIHLAQMYKSGTIAKYDYGNEVKNTDHYGQPNPPVYDMTRIPKDLPLYVSCGGKDFLSDVKDAQHLLNCLKGHDVNKLVVQYVEDYAHADFVLGVNAHQIVYNPVMAFFQLH